MALIRETLDANPEQDLYEEGLFWSDEQFGQFLQNGRQKSEKFAPKMGRREIAWASSALMLRFYHSFSLGLLDNANDSQALKYT
jgi:hypothetical protein